MVTLFSWLPELLVPLSLLSVPLLPLVVPASIGSVIGFMGGGSSSSSSTSSLAPFCSGCMPIFPECSLLWEVAAPEAAPPSCSVLCLCTLLLLLLLALEELDLKILSKLLPAPFLTDEDGGSGGGGGGGGGRSDVAAKDLSTLLWLSLRNGGGSHFLRKVQDNVSDVIFNRIYIAPHVQKRMWFHLYRDPTETACTCFFHLFFSYVMGNAICGGKAYIGKFIYIFFFNWKFFSILGKIFIIKTNFSVVFCKKICQHLSRLSNKKTVKKNEIICTAILISTINYDIYSIMNIFNIAWQKNHQFFLIFDFWKIDISIKFLRKR